MAKQPTIKEMLLSQQKQRENAARQPVVSAADSQSPEPDTGEYIEMNLDELEKDDLVDVAARLKIDSPSNLKRWGEDRLREEIRAKAEEPEE